MAVATLESNVSLDRTTDFEYTPEPSLLQGLDYGSSSWQSSRHHVPSFGLELAPKVNDKTPLSQHDTRTEQHHESSNRQRLSFLHLPLEIRLEIYQLIYLSHPMGSRLEIPGYTAPLRELYITRHVSNSHPINSEEGQINPGAARTHSKSDQRPLLSSDRPLCYIPTALLLTHPQIHAETSSLSFIHNEFPFSTCFTSGLYSAHNFTHSLAASQRRLLRWLRIDLEVGDLRGGQGLAAWLDCCKEWVGVKGLRIRIGCEREAGIWGEKFKTCEFDLGVEDVLKGCEEWEVRQREFAGTQWWEAGIMGMKSLQRIEVELLSDWSDDEKLAWCARLEEQMRERDSGTEVICVERRPFK